jgi:3-oxoacyl-[acyl-carrier-protein] synthase II
MTDQDVLITGIGIVSSLGEGVDAHWSALSGATPSPMIDDARYAPYPVHPLVPVDWNLQIPKRSDQRQMENWQRLGVYTAGLALDAAGLKGDEALCSTMDMIVAAGGGERDEAVDSGILQSSLTRADTEVLLNEKLTTELRPTLFLAQLSNLLAGNISIVHKVTGSSRTFMGEEGAGIAAVETGVARIRCGQSTHVLVGGAFHTEHPDHFLALELGGLLHRAPWAPVWTRSGAEGGGLVAGSGAAFLMLESRAHAAARGRQAFAAIEAVKSGRARRQGDGLAGVIGTMIDDVAGANARMQVISGATGAHAATEAEKAALDAREGLAVRGIASLAGYMKEAQFPFTLAIAAIAASRGKAFPPFDPAHERPATEPTPVLATTIGCRRSEGVALVTAA